VGLKKDVIKDFDQIARLNDAKWDHNKHYLPYLLNHVPQNCMAALDIGCGVGEFTRLLAQKSHSVIGIDFSPKMIERAIKESAEFPNIEYQLSDFIEQELNPEQFNCIVSIATIHLLPLEMFLRKAKGALKPGGVLLVLDLYETNTMSDFFTSVIAVPINMLYMLIKTGKVNLPKEDILVWNEHAKNDQYLTLHEIKATANTIITGASVKRHLFWRYSLIWKKPF